MTLVVSSTGLSASARRKLEASVAALRGTYTADLTDRTTHLVARSVTPRSAKLACARRLGLPVVLPEWVHDSAAAGRQLPLDEGLVPALAGVVLCVSGDRFTPTQREQIQRAVELSGGRYSTQLDSTCTHLVTSGPGGAKDDALVAMPDTKTVRVTPAWLHDSLRRGVAQEENMYAPPKRQVAPPPPTPVARPEPEQPQPQASDTASVFAPLPLGEASPSRANRAAAASASASAALAAAAKGDPQPPSTEEQTSGRLLMPPPPPRVPAAPPFAQTEPQPPSPMALPPPPRALTAPQTTAARPAAHTPLPLSAGTTSSAGAASSSASAAADAISAAASIAAAAGLALPLPPAHAAQQMAARACGVIVGDPLPLLRRAWLRGELPQGEGSVGVGVEELWLDGRRCVLDAPTEMTIDGSSASAAASASSSASAASASAVRGSAGANSSMRYYSLRDLLFGLQGLLRELPHPQYFLACVKHAPKVEPVRAQRPATPRPAPPIPPASHPPSATNTRPHPPHTAWATDRLPAPLLRCSSATKSGSCSSWPRRRHPPGLRSSQDARLLLISRARLRSSRSRGRRRRCRES